jgi:hypothetical protein
MVLHFFKQRPVASVRATWHLRLLCPAQPADAVVVGSPAPRALEASGPLFRLFGEELSFVHFRILYLRAEI